MSNSLTSNITQKLLRSFLLNMESQRVLSKTVNTQLFQGKFSPASGATIDVKRPHRYNAYRDATGDLTSDPGNVIISGKATATVQDYITVEVPFSNYEEALYLDQEIDVVTKPAAEECTTVLETSFAEYMQHNCGLAWGDPDVAVDAWSDIAGPMALLKSLGVPAGDQYYAMNPYTVVNLADAQNSLYGSDKLISTAWEDAQISTPFAGLKAIGTDSLANRTAITAADMAGALSAAPTATYLAAKDNMTQSWALSGLTASATIKAGDVLEVTGKYYIHQRTKQTFVDGAGNAVKFRAIATADVTLDTAGAGTVTVSAPAIYETSGAYNTVNAALAQNDVVTILGTTATLYQPNLFYHKDAFSIAFVKLPKLYSTDTIVTTNDGISIRCSKYSNGTTNTQKIRFDVLPAFATLNPFLAGHGYGV